MGIRSGAIDSRERGLIGLRKVVVRSQMSCSPCYIEYAKNCPRDLACLKELSAADVRKTCKTIIMSGNANASMRSNARPVPP